MHGPMQVRRDDGLAGRRDYLGKAEKKRNYNDMDCDRRQSHREQVPRGDRLLSQEQVQFGQGFSGGVYRRHAFDIR
jgi:hypothetical protein